ncbi:hypothetical protein C8P66_11027 [Humitalea rosea]|uniref:Uncharacterized protein n=1 Tax=Humitalea rosea TaxID=990373 RepID=A0A2W7IGU5_9PROT|nr:hypothetical protein [Humitalea rosea]PZW45829.1 hypothetical protein C8P66_11027 [Humitalea rosea]
MPRPVGSNPGELWSICAIGASLLLAGCATPAVITAPAIEASMPRDTTSLPVTAIAEPTGDPPITLPTGDPPIILPEQTGPEQTGPEPIPPARPRSGPAATP